jgi:hypothetical protein
MATYGYPIVSGTGITVTSTTPSTMSSTTWKQWIQGTHSHGTATWNTTTNDTTWAQWTNVGYTTTGLTTRYQWQDEVWGRWEEDERSEEERRQARDELQARREQQSRERLAREQERMENQRAAKARAQELLDMVVADEDRVPGLDLLQFRGSDGDLYRLEMHRETVHGNVVRVDEHGCILGRACVAPGMYVAGEGALPTPDGWVGQYLGLKFDTEEFLSHANWSQVRGCQQPDVPILGQRAA